jgi:hypothetical protein
VLVLLLLIVRMLRVRSAAALVSLPLGLAIVSASIRSRAPSSKGSRQSLPDDFDLLCRGDEPRQSNRRG